MIADEAVEAGYEAMAYLAIGRDEIRAILEAAAPHMLAGVLESAADDVHDRAIGMDSKDLTDHRGYMGRHNVSAAALWLRERADKLRPTQ